MWRNEMSKKKIGNSVTAVAALGAIVALGAAGGVLSSRNLAASSVAAAVPAANGTRSLPGSFSEIIERVAPAVVSIRVTGAAPQARPGAEGGPAEIPEPFKRFFNEEFGKRYGFQFGTPNGQPNGQPRRAPRVQGMGSGFFIDADGHIVTNNHVVGNADKIEVMLKGGDTFEAELVGRDPKTDLALLKVKGGEKFPYVRFGDSGSAKVGDWVIALGSPFGLGQTATTGIVSARGRDIGAGPYDDFLQIDAPINKGNSGGPTFNVRGEVIGVNTAIISPTGVSAGIGFAVPSNMAKNVIAQLLKNGSVSRGWLGVNIQSVTKDLASGLGLAKPEGALVSAVTKGGPAEKAGVQTGDVIVAVDGERIEKLRELPRHIANLAAGQDAKMTVFRGGKERILAVTMGAMPKADGIAASSPSKSDAPRFGMKLAALDDELRARFGLGRDDSGVIVSAVDPNGTAAEKGIRPGDVIRRMSGQAVSSPADVVRIIEKALAERKNDQRKALLVLVNRKGSDRYVALPLRDA
jgi:serine protease Do